MMSTQMKVALVFCPFGSISQPPTGISYLAASLEHKYPCDTFDINVSFHDFCKSNNLPHFSKEGYDPAEVYTLQAIGGSILESGWFLERWADTLSRYHVVGFSLFSSNIEYSMQLAGRIKSKNAEALLIAGGPSADPSCGGEEILKSGCVDIIVPGEGEASLEKILDAHVDGKRPEGRINCCSLSDGLLRCNERAGLVDVDSLPFPNYAKYNLALYQNLYVPVVASRGCINKCHYCSETAFWQSFRARSPENVAREIEFHVHSTGQRNFVFSDSLINGDLLKLRALCGLIADLAVRWYGNVCVRKGMTVGMLEEMKRAGCESLNIGVESGSDKVLREMNKRYNLALVSETLRNAAQAGIKVATNWFVGYPTETEKDFLDTLGFIGLNRSVVGSINLCGTCFIAPGSFLARNMDALGIHMVGGDWHTDNGENTMQIRRERYLRFQRHCESLNLAVIPSVDMKIDP